MGGFQDDLGKSEELSLRLFRDLVESDVNFILGLCCIGSLNTTLRRRRGSSNCCSSAPFPIFYGCGVDVETGDIFPAKFEEQGPGTAFSLLCLVVISQIPAPARTEVFKGKHSGGTTKEP